MQNCLKKLSEFEKRVATGLIRKVIKGNLVLYNYTDKCTYEKAWDNYTRAARGIIFDAITNELIAYPFPKFFNLGEMPETTLNNLPLDQPYTVTEKIDGSLGIIYYYNNEWHVATRGSFDSEQAIKAKTLLKKYDMNQCWSGLTYLVEIIYPENKIVVNYGNDEKLVLIGIYSPTHELDLSYMMAPGISPFPIVSEFKYTIEEMIKRQKTMPKDQEGFVVRFDNGLRVKIKGEEYLKIHKMISRMSPLSFWESMCHGVVNRQYIQQLPEEFRKDFQLMVETLETQYQTIMKEIIEDTLRLPIRGTNGITKDDARQIGMLIQSSAHSLKHPSAIFPYVLSKQNTLDKYIMKTIRPTGNQFKFSK